jgi:phage shock protein A
MEDQMWKLDCEYKKLETINKDLEQQIEATLSDIAKLKDSKERSEKNVDELREKVRVLIRENE